MINKALNIILDILDRQRMAIALAKGAAARSARNIDYSDPLTWEFSGFSQNGEDGILDVLLGKLVKRNRYFVEIGASDGIENNTAWLAAVDNYNGLMIEGDKSLVERANRLIARLSVGLVCHALFVTKQTLQEIRAMSVHMDPDVFSLDIDGVDYHIANEIFSVGFRPKIFVVEYNAVYGPDRCLTVPYDPGFDFSTADDTQLYYGVSIAGWRRFFDKQGYRFVTVDANGVNGFFVDPSCFDESFLDDIEGLAFAENQYQQRKFGFASEKQFELIEQREFIDI